MNGIREEALGMIEEFSGVPVNGRLPWMKEINRETMLAQAEKHISMDRIAACLGL